MKPVKVLFLANNCVGVINWRMAQFHNQFNQGKKVMSGMFGCNWEDNTGGVSKWEQSITESAFKQDKQNEEFWKSIMASDVVVYGYSGHPGCLALIDIMHKMGKKVLTECDDYVFNIPNYNPGFRNDTKSLNVEKVFKAQMNDSDGAIVTCEYMRKEYLPYNSNIWVVPNSIDMSAFKKSKEKNERIVIGWIGAAGHNEDLRILEKVIPEILTKYDNVEFHLVHGIPDYLKDIKHDRCIVKNVTKWVDIRKYPAYLAGLNFDIGLAPLLDNTFNRCKSNIRWLEYAGLKIPCVASNIENFKNTITDGKDGFLCNYEVSEWVEKIGKLVESEELRKAIGKEAWNNAYVNFNIVKNSDKYADIIREVYKNDSKRIDNGSEVSDIGYGHDKSEMVGYDFN